MKVFVISRTDRKTACYAIEKALQWEVSLIDCLGDDKAEVNRHRRIVKRFEALREKLRVRPSETL